MPRNPNCKRCDLAATCKTVCLWGKGPKHADLMLVGEAPGAQEDAQGKPFVGESGRILDECLRNAGLDPDSVYITNAVKCRPPNNDDPTPAQLGACVRYLIDEIQTVQPKVIVCVGRWALKALTGETAINRARGRILAPLPKLRLGDVKLIATTHPAAYLHQGRNQAVLAGIVEDLRYVENLIHSETPKSLRFVLPTWALPELRVALAHLMGASKIACDLEWTAIPNRGVPWPWTPGTELLSMSLTGRVNNVLVTVAFSWPTTVPDDRLLDWLDSLDLIFHNAMADVIWMLSQGLRPRVKGDSMLLSYLLDEHKRAALKGLGPLVTGVKEGWAIKPWTKRPTTRKGWLELLNYNADDTETTLLLHEGLVEQLLALEPTRRDNIARLYQKLILPAVVPFARTALNGTPIDEKALRKEITIHQQKRQDALEELAQITSLRIDIAERLAGSPAKVVRYAREAYGLEIDSSRAEDLSDYINEYPALKSIQSYKHERKMLGTYLEPWQRLLQHQDDGRLHSIYLLGATRTGRLSAELEEGGSLLLTPRDDWMRNLIAAPDNDWEIQAADYSQIELRMAAWLAPERTMRQLFREGVDLHLRTAMEVSRDATMEAAELLCLRAGLPTDRASSKILSELFRQEAAGGKDPEQDQLLSDSGSKRTNKEAWSWFWRQSGWGKESVLERRQISSLLSSSPKDLLRKMRSDEKKIALSSQKSQPLRQQGIEHRDAVLLLSRAGARVLETLSEQKVGWKERRQRAKGVGFGFIFGMQAEKFKDYAKSNYGETYSEQEAIEAREAFFRAYPDLKVWHGRKALDDFNRGYTVTPFGRYRFDLPDVTKAINSPIQASATDLMLLAYTLIDERIQKRCPNDAFIIGFVHDAVLVLVRKTKSNFIKKIIKQSMETPSLERVGVEPIPVPLVADVKSGKTWAQAQ